MKELEQDLSKQEADILALDEEIKQITENIANEYVDEYLKSENVEQLLENPRNFLLDFVNGMKDYLENKIKPKLEQKESLEAKLKDGKQDLAEKKAMSELKKVYKDADFEELVEFFENELPKKQQSEFNELNLYDALKKLYEMKYADKLNQKDEELPTEVSGSFDDESQDELNASPMSRY